MSPIQEAKARLRQEMRRRRRDFSGQAPDAGLAAARAVLDAGLVAPNAVAGLYWPMAEELDARPLIEALWREGRRVVLPATPPKGAPLIFRRFTRETALKPGPFGTHEPPPGAPALCPTVVFAPLLAFDGQGRRLGYGAGYYDRSLQALRRDGDVKAYGLAFAGQETPRVPTDALDQPLDGVVTERGFRLFTVA